MTEKEKFIKSITTFPFSTLEELEKVNLIYNASKETKNNIRQVFEYYSISTDCIALFGNWAVSEGRDIVNISPNCSHYSLFSNNPILKTEDEIFAHLNNKSWFDEEQKNNLVNAMSFLELKFK